MCIISETMYLCGHSFTILVLCKYEDPIEHGSVDNDADGINHIWPFRYGDIRLGPCRAGKQVFKGKKKDELCPTCGDRSFRRWCTEKRRRRGDKKWERSMLKYRRQMARRAREARKQAETEKNQAKKKEKKQKQETMVEENVLVMKLAKHG